MNKQGWTKYAQNDSGFQFPFVLPGFQNISRLNMQTA